MKSARTWLRRNAIGFPLIAIAIALLLVTVTWPTRAEQLGFRTPVQTVAAGATGEIEGARLTMRQIEPDLDDSTYGGSVRLEQQAGQRPEDGKVLTYEFTVTPSAAPSEDVPGCAPVATDGERRWAPTNLGSVRRWIVARDLASYCSLDESFVLTFVVPKDADVVAVDLLVTPPPEGDAMAADSLGHVVRFDAD